MMLKTAFGQGSGNRAAMQSLTAAYHAHCFFSLTFPMRSAMIISLAPKVGNEEQKSISSH
jgi:hypothetical protein